MAKNDDLKNVLKEVPKDELRTVREELASRMTTPQVFGAVNDSFWQRDPFVVARDVCGSRVEIYHGKRKFNDVLIYDVQAWRDLPKGRGVDIAGRDVGMVYSFPLKRGKPTGGVYHRLSVIAHPDSTYPTGLITLAGVQVDDERIDGLERVFRVLEVDEATTGEPFVVLGHRVLVPTTQDIRVLVSQYDVRGQDPKEVRGFKAPRQ